MIETLAGFNRALRSTGSREERIRFMRENLLHGAPYVFKEREADYFEFRTAIADRFGIGFHEVFIVGSAKLGYSYIKGTQFSLESDIDVVLVSSTMFESISNMIREYDYQMLGGKVVLNETTMQRYFDFLRYMIRGWMRPDMLPYGLQSGQLQNEWFDFFRSISYGRSAVGDYAVKAGLFKDYDSLEHYYLSSVEKHYDKLTIR